MGRVLLGGVLLALAGLLFTACGGSSDSGASELARQRELSEARDQAVQDARQSAHIKQLERRLKSLKRHETHGGGSPTAPVESAPEPVPNSGDWPGGSGFTAILASLPSQSAAESTQAEATGRGLDAGILYSSDFASLRPGYWVVFSGVFSNDSDAADRANRAHRLGYSDAYPRFVAP